MKQTTKAKTYFEYEVYQRDREGNLVTYETFPADRLGMYDAIEYAYELKQDQTHKLKINLIKWRFTPDLTTKNQSRYEAEYFDVYPKIATKLPSRVKRQTQKVQSAMATEYVT